MVKEARFKKSLTLDITPEIREWLERISKTEDRPLGYIVRRILINQMNFDMSKRKQRG